MIELRIFAVNYASAIVWEIRESQNGSEPMMRLLFKNGTNDTFHTYNMFGQSGDIPISMFIENLAVRSKQKLIKVVLIVL